MRPLHQVTSFRSDDATVSHWQAAWPDVSFLSVLKYHVVQQERRKAAELEAQNQLLSQHLVETTNSFREALQLVESLMGGMYFIHHSS